MTKKLTTILIVIAILLMLCLTGCKKSDTGQNANSTGTSETSQVSGTTNTGDTASSAGTTQTTDITESVSVKIKTQENKYNATDGTNLITSSVDIPTITGGSDGVADAISYQMDKFVLTKFDDYVQQMFSDAKTAYASGESDNTWIPYAADRTVTVERCDDSVVSFSVTEYFNTGGVHGTSVIIGYSFDAKSGNMLTLENMAEDSVDMRSFIYGNCIEYLKTFEFSDSLFTGYEDTLSALVTEGNWYLNDDGLIQICNEYDVAPYAVGPILILTAYKDMKGMILPEYMPS